MSRPKNKTELLDLSQQNYQKLMDFVDKLSTEQQQAEFVPGIMNRNIRDVLAHLHHWHLMMLDWYTVGMAGDKPDMPAKGYTWKTTPELNRTIWEKYNVVGLTKIRHDFADSFAQLQTIIQSHSNEELFTKKLYKWTGSTSLGSYLVSATSSHYDWGLKLMKKGLK